MPWRQKNCFNDGASLLSGGKVALPRGWSFTYCLHRIKIEYEFFSVSFRSVPKFFYVKEDLRCFEDSKEEREKSKRMDRRTKGAGKRWNKKYVEEIEREWRQKIRDEMNEGYGSIKLQKKRNNIGGLVLVEILSIIDNLWLGFHINECR